MARKRLLTGDETRRRWMGFAGFQWHTHADLLAAASGLAEDAAVRRFVDDVLTDRKVIALWGVPGEVRDVWVSDDPDQDAAYPIEGEVIELRYWSGRPWSDPPASLL